MLRQAIRLGLPIVCCDVQAAEADPSIITGLVLGRPTSASSLQVKTHPQVAAVSCEMDLLAAYMSCDQHVA